MKKLASSSLKNKTQAKRASAKNVSAKMVVTRLPARRSAVKVKKKIKRSVVSAPIKQFESMTTPIGEIAVVDSIDREPETVSVTPHELPPIVKHDIAKQRRIMWVGVVITMTAIVVIWGWTLQYSLARQSDTSLSAQTQLEIDAKVDDFTKVYEEVSKALEDLKVPEPSYSNESQATLLTPEELAKLREKIEETATEQN